MNLHYVINIFLYIHRNSDWLEMWYKPGKHPYSWSPKGSITLQDDTSACSLEPHWETKIFSYLVSAYIYYFFTDKTLQMILTFATLIIFTSHFNTGLQFMWENKKLFERCNLGDHVLLTAWFRFHRCSGFQQLQLLLHEPVPRGFVY